MPDMRTIVLLLFLVVRSACAQARAEQPPNIILILADDLGYAELGCYGQKKIQTPRLDALAAEGVRFTRFYSASTVCAPARCSLMTALHTGHSQIRGNKELGGWGPEEPEGQLPLPNDARTIAEALHDRGYTTGIFGKWGLGGPGSEGHPCGQGFDSFYGYLCQRVAHNFYPTHLWRNHNVDIQRGNTYFPSHQKLECPPLDAHRRPDPGAYAHYRGRDYSPEEITREAIAFIERSAERPFFVYFPSTLPHAALQAPPEWVDRYPREWDAEPYLGQAGYLPCERPRATYAAMISFLDDAVGRLVDAVERAGVAQRTIIIFTSDNGTTFNGGVDRAFFDSLGGLRGHKTNLYEGGIRVPLIVRWPGVVAPGTTADTPCVLYDLPVTLAEVAGAELAPEVDGVSLVALLRDGRAPTDRALYWEFPEGARQQALLFSDAGSPAGRWKAIRPDLTEDPRRVELYDLLADSGEDHDISVKHPALVARALEMMRASHTPSEQFPIAAVDTE